MENADQPERKRAPMLVLDEMLTLNEAAELAGVHRMTIRKWIMSEKLPAARYRKTYVISKVVLAMTVATLRMQKDPDAPVHGDAKVEPDAQLLTMLQTAEMLGVSKQRVDQLSKAGKLGSVRLSERAVRYRRETVEQFIRDREQQVVPSAGMELLSVSNVARELNVNHLTVRAWIDDGKLQAVRLGPKSLRVKRGDLTRFLNRREVRKRIPARRTVAQTVTHAGKTYVAKDSLAMKQCKVCQEDYEVGSYGAHLTEAEHVRAKFLRSNN